MINCTACKLRHFHYRPAEYTAEGYSLCYDHFCQWAEGRLTVKEIKESLNDKN